MCVTMVIIYSKTLEKKKGVDDVTSRVPDVELREPQTMSKGTTLFSCGTVEADRWRALGRGCAVRAEPAGASLDSLWDVLPEACQRERGWGQEAGTAGAITSLIRDLSLSEAPPTAPPSKRQCRSLSFPDELGGCRSAWRPQGSRVWAAVEKRRCHSGGSVRGSGGASYPPMQRSSSFSLPARSNAPPLPPPLPCLALPALEPPRPLSLSLSHEQISPCTLRGPSAASSPDSTPELGRRRGAGGLARSRSQPCVLNDKKIGMKRRRPEDAMEQRPSLDLAKMTQKLQNFQSLSCTGISGADCCQPSHAPSSYSQCETAGAEPQQKPGEGGDNRDDSSNEELDSEDLTGGTANGEEGDTLWEAPCKTQKDMYQLGGELDIEQIERN
ncbi:protein FAM53B-like [Megalops cyprinoides]|uniref:protein FAM53B-like n=1 Tax=Megalops cyprinoides TaxID=118141 RepID=UPI00186516A3|nr:protein FAM53B-like [Megalops cyprinoides]XP_036402035.1 protein FAM53B-like [Megalops cyprinoides]XP_036402036.1 protein FAM53B-like [Megalops cyprinoides]